MAGFLPTLFERLCDDTPSRKNDAGYQRRWSTDELRESVARDLESLLNSRIALYAENLDSFPESQKSILSYGMTDFVGMSLANPSDRDDICRALEQAIAYHEPRLHSVKVSLETNRTTVGCLRFGIKAVLHVNPTSEPVSFDALLQPNTLQYAVASGRTAIGS